MAARLHISQHTLRDHVKSIFGKVGARSCSELMAQAWDHAGLVRPGKRAGRSGNVKPGSLGMNLFISRTDGGVARRVLRKTSQDKPHPART